MLGLAKKPSNPRAELLDALASINVDAAEVTCSALEPKQRRILVTGTDKELAAIEAEIETASLPGIGSDIGNTTTKLRKIPAMRYLASSRRWRS
jgi:hypothetical protein